MPLAEEPTPMEGDALTLQTQQDQPATYDGPNGGRESRSDITPTNETPHPMQLNTTMDYSPVEPLSFDTPEQLSHVGPSYSRHADADHVQGGHYGQYADHTQADSQPGQSASYLDDSPIERSHNGLGGLGNGGLRVANRASSGSDDDWQQDALRSMNLGR